MQQPPLLEIAERRMDDASLEAYFQAIAPHLSELEIATFKDVCRYLAAKRVENVTGGELEVFTGVPRTSIRPRLHDLQQKGWLHRTEDIRASRAPHERRAHGYWPALPLAAIDRLQESRASPPG